MRRPAEAALAARRAAALGTILAAGLAASGGAAARAAEPIGQINGTLFGKDQKGIPGLTIAAIPQSGGRIHGTSSDETGRYMLNGLETDTYAIVVATDAGLLRKDGVRVRPLFRSIVDFTVGAEAPAAELPPVPPAPAAAAPADPAPASCTWVVTSSDRTPVGDARVAITPIQGAGRQRRGRTSARGEALLTDLESGTYRLSVRAPGFITWSLGPIPLKTDSGQLRISLTLTPFPMSFKGTLEDQLLPVDPIPPAARP